MADEKKEPVIGKSDRPGAVDLEARLSDLKLRDLVTALGSQAQVTERIKPEGFKPELHKEWWKPELFKENFKPEHFKPELIKELSKPELKPDPIDSIFQHLVATLTPEQVRGLHDKLAAHVGGGAHT
ncbi:MAG TPA: hypothetical protein VHQ90_24675 [Thermoanaerobaculia bacterium]|nr:hypothetical protein [Thermoanaerobaculia bacterium]